MFSADARAGLPECLQQRAHDACTAVLRLLELFEGCYVWPPLAGFRACQAARRRMTPALAHRLEALLEGGLEAYRAYSGVAPGGKVLT